MSLISKQPHKRELQRARRGAHVTCAPDMRTATRASPCATTLVIIMWVVYYMREFTTFRNPYFFLSGSVNELGLMPPEINGVPESARDARARVARTKGEAQATSFVVIMWVLKYIREFTNFRNPYVFS